ncbi:MAG: penicillin acylase family protein [Candidatus Hydrogenedentes bacterium]|nr:penicillin acylase family protein [Candidatus Hydrogenedentota bacterium]
MTQTPKRILATGALFAALLITCVAQAQESNPSALWQDATLYRDDWGVPHIYANTPRAMAFAFGYAQAEDHLDTMLLAYRMAQGRLAEVLGEAYTGSDRFAIRAGHRQVAHAAYANGSEATRELCDGFAQGVNAYLFEHEDALPPWAEAIHPADILGLWHAFLMYYAPYDLAGVYRPQAPTLSSTAIALAPQRTPNQAAILAINPHQFYDGPFQWYEAHLALPDYDAYGVTLYGLPLILQGHNASVAWALTPNFPDFADMFTASFSQYERDPGDPSLPSLIETEAAQLYYLTHARPFLVAGPNGTREEHEISFLTERGPVVEDASGGLYVWHVGGYTALEGFAQLAEMGRAQNLDAFQAALNLRQIPCFHVLYADKTGTLFYLYNATVADKQVNELDPDTNALVHKEFDWSEPVDGNYELFAWDEPVALDQLPSVINPQSGYLLGSGSPPWESTLNAPINGSQWPSWFVNDADRFRTQWLRRHLRSGLRSPADIQQVLFDSTVPTAASVVPWLVETAAKQRAELAKIHPEIPDALAILQAWDFRATTGSEAMPLFSQWWDTLTRNAGDQFPDLNALAGALLENAPQAQDLAINALVQTVQTMMNAEGTIHVPWDAPGNVAKGDPAGAITGDPILVAGTVVTNGEPGYATQYGYGPTLVVELTQSPAAWSVAAQSTSEKATRRGDRDQQALFRNRAFKMAHYRQEEVWREAVSARGRAVTLLPKGVSGIVQIQAQACVDASLKTHLEGLTAPEDSAFFTLPVEVIVAKPTPLETRVQFTVPAEACDDENLESLSLCVRSTGDTWTPLEEQLLDADSRTLSGVFPGLGTLAVLGPQGVFLPAQPEPPEPATPGIGLEEPETPKG